ncbi:MAG TPA: DNA repair protein [Gammaproteobacteria bacterium]|nr:DNA repair protein [Gammaproteobacteria bacterium]
MTEIKDSGGSFDVIRQRLAQQCEQLRQETDRVNQQRLAHFGQSEMKIFGRTRVQTENNCMSRDIVQLGDMLLFGYNVFIGLKSETLVGDVFSLYKNNKKESTFELEPIAIEESFLKDSRFQQDFSELYKYYKNTKLIQLIVQHKKLLMAFQIGERREDIRVFRWHVSPQGFVQDYIDNRGERDLQPPPAHDFQWTLLGRENQVLGRFPHINIEDEIFVETTGGDLTIKIENNTLSGEGVYAEPVEDATQSLDDASFAYAKSGRLILLKIRPYREETWRYLVYNRDLKTVVRLDAIGESCVALPEDHGIIFPGGYYLNSGEWRTFNETNDGFFFQRKIVSPNGEDILYIFYHNDDGQVGLLTYNLIEKKIKNPIYAHGYALAANGDLLLFSSEGEAARQHPMQLWQTPFYDAASQITEESDSLLDRIGNSEMVRWISELLSVCRVLEMKTINESLFVQVQDQLRRLFDQYLWLTEEEFRETSALLNTLQSTIQTLLDEYEKQKAIMAESAKLLNRLLEDVEPLKSKAASAPNENAEYNATLLSEIRHMRGRCIGLQERRYVDKDVLNESETVLNELETNVAQITVEVLAKPDAFKIYTAKLPELKLNVETVTNVLDLEPIQTQIEETANGLGLLSDLVASLETKDVQLKTNIIAQLSKIYAEINQLRSFAEKQKKNLRSSETKGEFAAQLNLFTQSIDYALSQSDTIASTDAAFSRLMLQLENMESQFGDQEEFLVELMTQREAVLSVFEDHKQQLSQALQQKALRLTDAAKRLLKTIENKAAACKSIDDLNTIFASDQLVIKVKEMIAQLFELEASVQAEDVSSSLKGVQDKTIRQLRDKSDLYSEGGNQIQLGRHAFSVNSQELNAIIVNRNEELYLHLTGTDFYEKVDDPVFNSLKPFWTQSLISETKDVYRAEYLAWMFALEHQGMEYSDDIEVLTEKVAQFASSRYSEGYIKGIHDTDAARIFKAMRESEQHADGQDFHSLARAYGALFLVYAKDHEQVFDIWLQKAANAYSVREHFSSKKLQLSLAADVAPLVECFFEVQGFATDYQGADLVSISADYVAFELVRCKGQLSEISLVVSHEVPVLFEQFKKELQADVWLQLDAMFKSMRHQVSMAWHDCWTICSQWIEVWSNATSRQIKPALVDELLMYILLNTDISFRTSSFDMTLVLENLAGEHELASDTYSVHLADFKLKLIDHVQRVVPGYKTFQAQRHEYLKQAEQRLRLSQFKPKPLTSFVRNRLINEVYLPIIGDNLAKQMGASGAGKRTDLMGLLMMISPPGYGKTTLMEYVADRLGLIFMKINCPSLGHSVTSLDPSQTADSTAKQELVKLNLALEMGSNVMLYLDDIQHTNPEFLQKFISLCDGTRRVEGVWKGETKTYDMRSKKFCVVMAGNPYTESGEVFKIPDMLANRADIYNLGDILGGKDEQFALSYIENAMTSNAVLARLATGEQDDIHALIKMAQGKLEVTSPLKQDIGLAEQQEMISVLQKMLMIQQVVLKINQAYIASAAQNDQYRVQPSFKLQGSYRNMNKMTEKVTSVLTEQEMNQLIDDHYIGEAQLLTTGAEDNLLQFKAMRNTLTEKEQQRWQQICEDYLRNKAMGGADSDVGQKIVVQLMDLVKSMQQVSNLSKDHSTAQHRQQASYMKASHAGQMLLVEHIKEIKDVIHLLGTQISESKPELPTPHIELINQPIPEIKALLGALAGTIEHSLSPLVRSLDKKMELDLDHNRKLIEISQQLKDLSQGT